MCTVIRLLSREGLVLEQTLTVAGSIVIAELFYKFHSFALECLAFLATWYVLDAVWQGAKRLQQDRR
jgi:hypothetical protein